jgi:hypothetical protein
MTELDRVAFRIDNDSVAIEVNGRPLVELVGEVERPFAEREGSPGIAGAYAPLELRVFDSVDEHFHGAPGSDLVCGPRDKTVLLGCDCGEPGCWPLMARVEVDHHTVTWDGFTQPHRDERWSYDAMRPLTFDRRQYDEALAALLAQVDRP